MRILKIIEQYLIDKFNTNSDTFELFEYKSKFFNIFELLVNECLL